MRCLGATDSLKNSRVCCACVYTVLLARYTVLDCVSSGQVLASAIETRVGLGFADGFRVDSFYMFVSPWFSLANSYFGVAVRAQNM